VRCSESIFRWWHSVIVATWWSRSAAQGGFGVLGATGFVPDQLELELKWIDEHIDGKGYARWPAGNTGTCCDLAVALTN
jgi:hypothetical protein